MNTIVVSGNYGYLDKIETTLKSILYHNKNINIHVINPDIPHEWFINLNQYTKQFGVSIIDEKIDPARLENLQPSFDHINQMAYGRFLIPDLINADKVLYLDSDIIVNSNIEDLFNIDLKDKMIYAVRDYHATDQFNSGVMLINNKKWIETKVNKQLLEMSKQHHLNGDQTIINAVFKDKIGELDPSYNYQVGFKKDAFWNHWSSVENYLNTVSNPQIIHYTTADKPFNQTSETTFRDKWWHYRNLQWKDIVEYYTEFDRSKIGHQHFDTEAFMFAIFAENHDIEELIKRMPNIHFDIAAYTDMAFLLKKLTKYDNVTLHPGVVGEPLTGLINSCDIYLDLNYGDKASEVIDQIVKRHIPIYAFEDTKAQDFNYDNYHVFGNNEMDQMYKTIKNYVQSRN